MKILLTAFDPFDGATINPALEAVQRVCAPEGVELIKLEVPTVFEKSIQIVTDAMRTHRPDAVLSIGQAAGRAQITPERVAINLSDARIPDNAGAAPVDEPIRADGPDAYFATIPVRAIVEALKNAGIPAAISNTAGTFVCNHLMYGVLDCAAQEMPKMRAGFIHVPCIPEQAAAMPAATPSMALGDIVRAIECAVGVIANV